MKQLATVLTLALVVMAGGCGSSSNSNNVNGNWAATLLGSNGSPSFGFTTTLSQSSNNSVSATNLNFTTATPCFAGTSTANGGFTLSGNFTGDTNGSLALAVQSSSPMNNTLNLQGTVKHNTIMGTWTLTGSTGCTGSGTFTMQR